MAYRDPEKQREYQREYRRRQRAEAKLGKLKDAPAKAELTRTVTTRTTRTEPLNLGEAIPLEELDREIYAFGTEAIQKARNGLRGIPVESLSVLDIKRLAELGVKLRNLAAASIEKREVTEEHRVVMTQTVLQNPEALEHANELLRLSALHQIEESGETDGASG